MWIGWAPWPPGDGPCPAIVTARVSVGFKSVNTAYSLVGTMMRQCPIPWLQAYYSHSSSVVRLAGGTSGGTPGRASGNASPLGKAQPVRGSADLEPRLATIASPNPSEALRRCLVPPYDLCTTLSWPAEPQRKRRSDKTFTGRQNKCGPESTLKPAHREPRTRPLAVAFVTAILHCSKCRRNQKWQNLQRHRRL